MRKSCTVAFYAMLFLTITACTQSGNEKNTGKRSSFNPEKLRCLAEKRKSPSALISKAQMALYFGIPEDRIKTTDNSSILTHPTYMTCQYSWDSERDYTLKMGENSVRMDAYNTVKVGNMYLIGAESIESGSSFIDYFIKIYSEKMIENKPVKINKLKPASTSMMEKALIERFILVEEGVGDIAGWKIINNSGAKSLQLHVLFGNIIFQVQTNISDSMAENLESAKSIAAIIISNCKNGF